MGIIYFDTIMCKKFFQTVFYKVKFRLIFLVSINKNSSKDFSSKK